MNQNFALSGTAQFTSTSGILFINGIYQNTDADLPSFTTVAPSSLSVPFFTLGVNVKAAGEVFSQSELHAEL